MEKKTEPFKGFVSNDHSNQRKYLDIHAYKYLGGGLLLMFLIAIMVVYLSPLAYMGSTALKSERQLADPDNPLIPGEVQTYTYESDEIKSEALQDRRPLFIAPATDEVAAAMGMSSEELLDIANISENQVMIEALDIPERDTMLEMVSVGQAVQLMETLTLSESQTALVDFLEEEYPQGDRVEKLVRLLALMEQLSILDSPVEERMNEVLEFSTIRTLLTEETLPALEEPPETLVLFLQAAAYGAVPEGVTAPELLGQLGQNEEGRTIFIDATRPEELVIYELQQGEQGQVLVNLTDTNIPPIPVRQINPSTKTIGRIEADIYYVPDTEGIDQEYGFIQELSAGVTLWVDPEFVRDQLVVPIALENARSASGDQKLELYEVPMDGETRILAKLQSSRESTIFVDPDTDEIIELDVRARGLDKVWEFHLEFENFEEAVELIDYPRLFRNTMIMSVVGALGTMIASTLVAYGFTRFRIPYANVLMIILISTIVLPPQVTQIPTYIVFRELGWIGTLLPLIVPHFFGNAYNVFLLRQYMMGIPLEMDEAARVDGANPFQILWYVIVPAARPAMVAVYLFHFLWAWNEFQQPLIYIGSNRENQVLATGLSNFSQIYSSQQNLMMAAGILTMIVPLVLFFFAQRIFMQGVVITGVEK